MTDRDQFGDFAGPSTPTQEQGAADDADRDLWRAMRLCERFGWLDALPLVMAARSAVRARMHPRKRAETEGR